MVHLSVLDDNPDHVRPDLCAPCGGRCCQQSPGIASPEDFGAPNREAMRERLAEAFATGRWAIDWYAGDPRGYEERGEEYLPRIEYVRPACQGHEGELRHDAWRGECTFHTANGCSIFETRPQGCRDLIPGEKDGETHCTLANQESPLHRAAAVWLPYRDVLDGFEGD